MSKAKRFGVAMIALCLLLAVWAAPYAAAEEYTYTVTLSAGNHAVFSDGSDTMTITGLKQGEVVSFGSVIARGIQLNDDSKYYVKGVRLSGRDNSTVDASAFTVNGDAMYVVAYGVQGEMVAYTINYIDEAGAPLADSLTLYGNVGDKPVVAYLYIEGYQPQAYNITRTLSANAAENQFDFIYSPIPEAPAAPAEETPEGGEEGGEEPAPTPVEIPENPTPVAGPTVQTPPEVPVDENGEPIPGVNTPVEIQDDDVPLAPGDPGFVGEGADGADSRSWISTPAGVATVAGGSAGILALLAILLLANKKRRKT